MVLVVFLLALSPWLVLWMPIPLKPWARFAIVLALFSLQAAVVVQSDTGLSLGERLDSSAGPWVIPFIPYAWWCFLRPTSAIAGFALALSEMVISTSPGFVYQWRAKRAAKLSVHALSVGPYFAVQGLLLIARVLSLYYYLNQVAAALGAM